MAEFLADTLEKAKDLANKNDNIIRSEDLTRRERERLIEEDFLYPIIRGWYLLVSNTIRPGDTTAWYGNVWNFIKQYLNERFGAGYCLSPETSLYLHSQSETIPIQIVVITSKGGSMTLDLPGNSSVVLYKDINAIPNNRVEIHGLQCYPLALSLIRLRPKYYKNHQLNVELALRQVDFDNLLRTLLTEGNQKAAGRLAGAYQSMNQLEKAREICQTMQAAGYDVEPSNPFGKTPAKIHRSTLPASPAAARIELMWDSMREPILKLFPDDPGLPEQPANYFSAMEAVYTQDAYHSLSIEGYQVTEELIERVRKNQWDPDNHPNDENQKEALAAKGYQYTFEAVEDSVRTIFEGKNPGDVLEQDHQTWFRELFKPMVTANILEPTSLAGYRNQPVYIQNARHVPPRHTNVTDMMDVYFKKLKKEKHASVRAVLGHFVFVYIHPYMDGNGRMGRFIMNAMFASGGFPWLVIKKSKRDTYMETLESASSDHNIEPFALFIRDLMKE